MADLLAFLQGVQGLGEPTLLAGAVYFLWKIDRSLAVVKESYDVLTDTLLRLVPGFRDAHIQSRAERLNNQKG